MKYPITGARLIIYRNANENPAHAKALADQMTNLLSHEFRHWDKHEDCFYAEVHHDKTSEEAGQRYFIQYWQQDADEALFQLDRALVSLTCAELGAKFLDVAERLNAEHRAILNFVQEAKDRVSEFVANTFLYISVDAEYFDPALKYRRLTNS